MHVLVDNEKAAERAVDLLFEKGHRNIGLIGGPREIYTAQERLRGYCNAHKKRSIPVQESLVYHGDYTMQGGVRALKDLVKRNPHMEDAQMYRILGTKLVTIAEKKNPGVDYGKMRALLQSTGCKNEEDEKAGEGGL